jgi:tetratricopeptide (TPR) repeat protein
LAVAGVAPAFSDQQIAALRSAYRVEPRNADTARAIGEALRARSSVGPPDYRALAEESMAWFRKGIDQNPYEAENYLRVGWCLDWLDRSEEAGPYFDKGELLDPNSYFVVAQVGLHHVALRNYAASKPWFERSLRLLYKDNQVAAMYLQIVNQKLIEEAAGVRAKLVRPSK